MSHLFDQVRRMMDDEYSKRTEREYFKLDDMDRQTKYLNEKHMTKKKNLWQRFKQSEHRKELSKRLKSFAWRAGMMFIAGSLDVTVNYVSDANLDNQWTVIVGLLLGELSKYLNKKYNN